MLRPTLAVLAILAALVTFPARSDALLWGLLGRDDRWRNVDPDRQNREAEPIIVEARRLDAEGRTKAALSAYTRVWKLYPGSRFAAEALFRSGRLRMKREDWRDAFDAYTNLVRSYPESPYFDQIVADLFDIGTAYEEGRGIHWLWVIPYADESRAVGVYETVIRTAPFSDYAPIALMRIAMIHRRENHTILAVDALDRLINFYPNTMLAADAHLLLAETFADEVKGPEYDQGATREAISYYRDFLLLYPENPMVERGEMGLEEMRDVHARSKLVMGEFFYDYRDDYVSAEVFFNESITIAPESAAAGEARKYLAKIDEIKANYPEGDWPRRKDLEYLMWWRDWPPPYSKRRTEVDDGADRPNIPGVDNPLNVPVGSEVAPADTQ